MNQHNRRCSVNCLKSQPVKLPLPLSHPAKAGLPYRTCGVRPGRTILIYVSRGVQKSSPDHRKSYLGIIIHFFGLLVIFGN